MDKKSTSDPAELKKHSKLLDAEGYIVIPIAFGRESGSPGPKDTTPYKENIIEADEKDKPEVILTEIMNKIANRKKHFQFYLSNYLLDSLVAHFLPFFPLYLPILHFLPSLQFHYNSLSSQRKSASQSSTSVLPSVPLLSDLLKTSKS